MISYLAITKFLPKTLLASAITAGKTSATFLPQNQLGSTSHVPSVGLKLRKVPLDQFKTFLIAFLELPVI
ncbi:hypothetical protein AVDCRST_MAG81-4552 [uncultured Synechococcales cyanobacterium]|uniref:Uncharacterized protein n=1 Tax=uncultured Synechococcales cyanobacterium TaxID=1936017 RepID=A0A6J4VW60_9CYAN|nr:hypothetical protein AVDCRST_MAG81-4552 [uncultured Synechococcales cyanobacterium]